nr:hypothetical protein [Candidatus Njordarchaeum guaymaensis]
MPKKIVSTIDYLKELEKRYPGLRYDEGIVKPWYSKAKKVLFDCGKTDEKEKCLEKALTRQDCEEFTIVSVIKESGEGGKTLYSVDESRFKRMGRENLSAFIGRFNKALKEPFTLSMQLFNRDQVELIGFSYVSPEEKAQLLRELQNR